MLMRVIGFAVMAAVAATQGCLACSMPCGYALIRGWPRRGHGGSHAGRTIDTGRNRA